MKIHYHPNRGSLREFYNWIGYLKFLTLIEFKSSTTSRVAVPGEVLAKTLVYLHSYDNEKFRVAYQANIDYMLSWSDAASVLNVPSFMGAIYTTFEEAVWGSEDEGALHMDIFNPEPNVFPYSIAKEWALSHGPFIVNSIAIEVLLMLKERFKWSLPAEISAS